MLDKGITIALQPKKQMNGLTSKQAQNLLLIHGLNSFKSNPINFYDLITNQLLNPLIILLLISGFISFCLGQILDAASIITTVAIVLVVALVQEYNSLASLEALKKISPNYTKVIRDGSITSIKACFLVPGDVVRFGRGDLIPADCKILECTSLDIDESNLT